MIIQGRPVGSGHPPYIVAEISGNHAGSFDNALALVRAAKTAGADAVKFQALQADRITSPHLGEAWATIKDGPWAGRRLHDLYKLVETPIEWWEPIMTEAKKCNITCFASVFDADTIPYLMALGVPAVKISSFELVDTPLVTACSGMGVPMILSTGMARSYEISAAINAIGGRCEFALLHCVSAYPAALAGMNIGRIQEMRRTYGCPVGLSNHSMADEAPVLATALGASLIEAHLMLDPQGICLVPDHSFSRVPESFVRMALSVRNSYRALRGSGAPDATHVPLRRSLFVVADVAEGEVLTSDNVRSIRPGDGMPPALLPKVLGRRAASAIKRGTPLSIEMLA